MKKYKDLCDYDFSDYAEEITGDALFKINGGAEVENSDKGVAGAKPVDTIKKIDGTVNSDPADFLEHCNQYKISADLKEKSGTIYGDNLYPCSAGCTIGKDGQEHHDLYMSVLLNGVSNVENIRKEIRSISNLGE